MQPFVFISIINAKSFFYTEFFFTWTIQNEKMEPMGDKSVRPHTCNSQKQTQQKSREKNGGFQYATNSEPNDKARFQKKKPLFNALHDAWLNP